LKKTIIRIIIFTILLYSLSGITYKDTDFEAIVEQNTMKSKDENEKSGNTIEIHSPQKLLNSNSLVYNFSDGFNVKSIIDDFQMDINFDSCGINNLFSIKEIGLKMNESTTLIKSYTDWIGPYIVRFDGESDSSISEHFTGGWHGFGDGESVDITARTTNYEIYADGKQVIGSTSGKADEIVISVTNEIMGYNTAEFVLEETVTYKIYDSTISVEVEIKALNDISILRYFGLQTQNSNFEKITYIYNDGSSISGSCNESNSSGPKSDTLRVNQFILSSENHPFTLRAWILNESLASFEYVSDDQPYAFTQDYGKSYFHLINGTPVQMKVDEKVFWKGGYSFGY